MKKTVSLLTTLSIIAACGTVALAADRSKNEPDVIVDNSKIIFEDQNAVIVDGVTLVPARGVFSAMGCEVQWDEEARTVKVTSATGVRYVFITIDSDVMQICTYKSILTREDVDYKLEVPAQIINDRTMIPLRAVSEAFDCEVAWDAEKYTVNISTGADLLLENIGLTPNGTTAAETAAPTEAPSSTAPSATQSPAGAAAAPTATAKPTASNGNQSSGSESSGESETEETANPSTPDNSEAVKETEKPIDKAAIPKMSLSTDATGAIKAGDEFTVYVDIENSIEGSYFSSITAAFEFDSSKFEYIEGSGTMLNNNDEPYQADYSVENGKVEGLGAKVVFVTLSDEKAKTKDGHVYKATFKSLNGESGTIALNDDFYEITGYESCVMFSNLNASIVDVMYEGKDLVVDKTPLVIGK